MTLKNPLVLLIIVINYIYQKIKNLNYFIDFIIRGYGEVATYQLIQNLNGEKDTKITGLISFKDNKIVVKMSGKAADYRTIALQNDLFSSNKSIKRIARRAILSS